MYIFKRGLCALALAVLASGAQAAIITTNLEDATNGGGFFGTVTFEDIAADTVKVTADVGPGLNAGLTQADILGIWLDVEGGISASDITASNFSPAPFSGGSFADNAVGTNLGGGVNLNGTGESGWDIGIALGSNGGPAFYSMTMFELSAVGLDALDLGSRVGLRVQSIEGVSGFSAGSSKLIGMGDTPPGIPEPGTLALLALGALGLGRLRKLR